ncbi:MAG: hypothetical protein ACE5IJ_01855 [Thermoplasmata archaeon]
MLKEVAMVSVVLALLLLNIITPTLIGGPESDIATIPMLLLDANIEEMQIYVKGALSDNRYTMISILVRGEDNESYVRFTTENETYVTKQRVLFNDTSQMRIDVTAFVGEDEWWLNCTARPEKLEDDTIALWISSEGEDGFWGVEELEDSPFRQRLFLRRG